MSPQATFPPDPTSVSAARRFVADAVEGLTDEAVDTVVLAVSELAANSVRHAQTDFTVAVDQDEREVRVTVTDRGSGRPEVQDPDPFTPSGRGLLIVDRVSDDWGARKAGDRNVVWFALRAVGGASPAHP